ncbi:hypothetical protein QBC46DRAFT_427615 [Diplogelasinospora grovesii]|uniref:F-box domain-containing protein n=1 Tax=Diplogelasinospora grovesii TaxID=303347 RepID=A0AAN6MY42_9PEZI|nr:hypothetical protein QBC46DRAFT_427615 [Diplogelasinospora grovesii]
MLLREISVTTGLLVGYKPYETVSALSHRTWAPFGHSAYAILRAAKCAEDWASTGSSIERVPLELWKLILSFLPDLSSLLNARRACRLLYVASADKKERLVGKVLINQIGPEVLKEAFLHFQSLKHIVATVETDAAGMKRERREFADNCLNKAERSPPPTRWSIRDALTIAAFHNYVRHFADRFFQAVGSLEDKEYDPHGPSLRRSLEGRPPTVSERTRVERALYRLEIYNRMYGWRTGYNLLQSGRDSTIPYFYAHFSPWENAQHRCIHDFLAREVVPSTYLGNAPAYNETARHYGISGRWASGFIELDEEILKVASMGLAKLYKIVAGDFEERSGLLQPLIQLNIFHGTLVFDMSRADNLGDREILPGVPLIDTPSFVDDGDAGPERVWRWSRPPRLEHLMCTDRIEQWPLRRWGYVM